MVKRTLLLLVTSLILFSAGVKGQNVVRVFDQVSFYNATLPMDSLIDEMAPLPEGFFRLSTGLVTTKLSETQLNQLSGSIRLDVVLKAACENFDCLCYVSIAFVSKDSALYDPDEVKRIEIARFITPFMDKNRRPDTVPYTYEVDYLRHLFQDEMLREQYDFWLELYLGSFSFDAWEKVAGCYGRHDSFYGSLTFTATETATELENNNVFIPLLTLYCLNNYREGSSDTIGKTTKSVSFTVEQDLTDAHLVLITSNHGSNSGGEEYNRRTHYVYWNGTQVLRYLPGRTSCEPFRIYNTQGNGIYGASPLSDAQWQSFSNWCPGDIIDTRIIKLGALSAGEYTFMLRVPYAVFRDQLGEFPVSLYFQGKTSGKLAEINVDVKDIIEDNSSIIIYPNPVSSELNVNLDLQESAFYTIYNTLGQSVLQGDLQGDSATINVSSLAKGTYYIKIIGQEVRVMKFVRE